jgi:hypothetical protein
LRSQAEADSSPKKRVRNDKVGNVRCESVDLFPKPL